MTSGYNIFRLSRRPLKCALRLALGDRLRHVPSLAVAALVAGALLVASPVVAAQKTAIFPFDIRDIGIEGDVFAKPEDEDLRRLKMVAEELRTLMVKDGKYEIVDLAPLAKEVDAASPYYKCDACEVPIAKQAGAELAVTGYAEKLSDALISLRLFAREAETGKLVKSMSAEIRGNTDELWMHGIRWLWRNRFNTETAKP